MLGIALQDRSQIPGQQVACPPVESGIGMGAGPHVLRSVIRESAEVNILNTLLCGQQNGFPPQLRMAVSGRQDPDDSGRRIEGTDSAQECERTLHDFILICFEGMLYVHAAAIIGQKPDADDIRYPGGKVISLPASPRLCLRPFQHADDPVISRRHGGAFVMIPAPADTPSALGKNATFRIQLLTGHIRITRA